MRFEMLGDMDSALKIYDAILEEDTANRLGTQDSFLAVNVSNSHLSMNVSNSTANCKL